MIKCELCGFESNATKLTSHLRQRHNISCDEYLEIYPDASVINNDAGETCPICNNKFKYLKLHINKYHPDEYKNIYPDTDMSNDNEYVSCCICGFRRKNISYHLLHTHGISAREYRKEYNLPTCSEAYKKSQSDASKKGKRLQNIINRNKSDKQRSIISERNKDPEFINKCKEGYNHDIRSKNTHERNLKMWKDPEYAKKMSDQLPSKYGKKHKYYSEVFNKEFSLKSTSEFNFFKLCEDNKDNWNITDIRYEEFPIKYMKDNIGHSYYPDFFIYINNELKFIVEVKWDDSYNDGNNKFKSSFAIKYCEDNDITYCWFKSRYNSNLNNLNEISLMPK